MAELQNSGALLALMSVPGAGNGVARDALRAAKLLKLELTALAVLGTRELLDALPPGNHQALANAVAACTADQREAAQRLAARCTKAGIAFIDINDANYPSAILDCLGPRAPALMCATGNIDLLTRRQAAVVGAREVSAAAAERARQCGIDIAQAGIVLTSGGAKGVDDAAQRGAIGARGSLISLLPQGLLTYRGSGYLRDALRENRALLLSACMPDAPWQTHAAVERNDYIAALAQTICVIEPKKTGGSIRTARAGLEFGRDVFVSCANESTGPCNELERAGAKTFGPGEAWQSAIATASMRRPAKQISIPGLE